MWLMVPWDRLGRVMKEKFQNLELRWKLLVLMMPLALAPLILIAIIVSALSIRQAYEGVSEVSNDDLDHMSSFTLDMLDVHYQQHQLSKIKKIETMRTRLRELTDLSYSLVEAHHGQPSQGTDGVARAMAKARDDLKQISVGETGYSYVIDSTGELVVHLVSEGENILHSRDSSGRHFIQEMVEKAVQLAPGSTGYILYPWRNSLLGDTYPRQKIVAYRYFEPWDWIIAVGSYIDELYVEEPFKNDEFVDLKRKILEKKVGNSGYIYAMDCQANLTIHPQREGQNIGDELSEKEQGLLSEMCGGRLFSILSEDSWTGNGEEESRKKIALLKYFKPWNWIVVVGTYEDELYRPAQEIRGRILLGMIFMTVNAAIVSAFFVFWLTKVFTDPIRTMTEAMGRVKGGRLEERLPVQSGDELGELAMAFNHMAEMLKRDSELEEKLAGQQKMASLGVLSSGVAHEINNPMGVILGYACHLEKKLDPDDPHYPMVREIRQESKRCVKIVQNLLSYARLPHVVMQPVDINNLLEQIIDFAAGHKDMENVRVRRDLAHGIPAVRVDKDQLRQVVMNLVLNGGAAMSEGGELRLSTRVDESGRLQIVVEDTGGGIKAEDLKNVFEPFFTTKTKGTGLGLAISREIVNAHRGTIQIESVEGQGTTVTVTLPIR